MLRDAEIQDLQETVCIQHQIVGLDIAVNEPLLMGRVKRGCRLHRDTPQPGPFRLFPCEMAQGRPDDQLHRDEGRAFHFARFVDVGDVRMIELAGHLGFMQKRAMPDFVRIAKDLQGDLALQAQIHGPPHGPHGAFAQPFDQAV